MSARVVVFHSGYGCETGCCGHVVQFGDQERFVFDHPDRVDWLKNAAVIGETDREFMERIVEEEFGRDHVADLDWENSYVVRD